MSQVLSVAVISTSLYPHNTLVTCYSHCTFHQIPDSRTLTIQLLGKDDSKDEDTLSMIEKWETYVDVFQTVGPSSPSTCWWIADLGVGLRFVRFAAKRTISVFTKVSSRFHTHFTSYSEYSFQNSPRR